MRNAIDIVSTALAAILVLAVALYFSLVLYGVNNPVTVQIYSAYRCPLVGSLAVQTINKINTAVDPQTKMAVKRVK